MLNTQPIQKQNLTTDGSLVVHSIFYTIQGEGPFTGYPAVFVRLAGCNLQCPGCDTDYTSQRETLSPEQIASAILATYARRVVNLARPIVVITGGEPFRQNIAPLVRTLASKGYRVQIETNGTLFIEDMPWDSITVVCSPKTGKINNRLLPHIDAFKYVARAGKIADSDGLPTEALDHSCAPILARPPLGNTKPVYLQPMDEQDSDRNSFNMTACALSCLKHGHILQLQIHKLVGVE